METGRPGKRLAPATFEDIVGVPLLWSQPDVRPLRLANKAAALHGAAAAQGARLSFLPGDLEHSQRMLHSHPHLKSITIAGTTTKQHGGHSGYGCTGHGRNDVLRPWRSAPRAPSLLPQLFYNLTRPLITQLDLHGVTGLSASCATAIALHLPNLTALSLRWDCTLEAERDAHSAPDPGVPGFFAPLRGLPRLTKLDINSLRSSQQDLNDLSGLIHLEHLSLWPHLLGSSRLAQLASLVRLHTLIVDVGFKAAATADLPLLASRLPVLTNLTCKCALLSLPSWRLLQGSASLTCLDTMLLPDNVPASLPSTVLPALRSLRVARLHADRIGAFFQVILMPDLRVLDTEVHVDEEASEADIRASLIRLMRQLPPLVGELAVRAWAPGDQWGQCG